MEEVSVDVSIMDMDLTNTVTVGKIGGGFNGYGLYKHSMGEGWRRYQWIWSLQTQCMGEGLRRFQWIWTLQTLYG